MRTIIALKRTASYRSSSAIGGEILAALKKRFDTTWNERGVVRLSGERAARRQGHWQALVRACEQCGRAGCRT
ncbi:MAG: 16S rRNA (uracil(1498)-N(3))-methyltransferase (EC [uncultured Caballeronia sp.]|nr:MAG: 16S rRNA (uracil(1498)-N(3))-methyltransferase (EC [uncultured Caballeronia sp.]